jgi:hypothetical protein
MLRGLQQSALLNPDDLALCQKVFDQICADANWDRGSLDGHLLASTVLTLFQMSPNTVEADLLAVVRLQRNDFEKRAGQE